MCAFLIASDNLARRTLMRMTFTGLPQREPLPDQGVNFSRWIPFDRWTFLAKTCWEGGISGTLELNFSFTSWQCHQSDFKCEGLPRDLQLPEILFYSSYDPSFALNAAETEGRDGKEAADRCESRHSNFDHLKCHRHMPN